MEMDRLSSLSADTEPESLLLAIIKVPALAAGSNLPGNRKRVPLLQSEGPEPRTGLRRAARLLRSKPAQTSQPWCTVPHAALRTSLRNWGVGVGLAVMTTRWEQPQLHLPLALHLPIQLRSWSNLPAATLANNLDL